MIADRYIEGLPFDKKLANVIGVDYSNDRDIVRISPNIEIEEWTEEHLSICEFVSDCNNDCSRCANNHSYDVEKLVIRTSKGVFEFERYCSHRLGSVWSNWY